MGQVMPTLKERQWTWRLSPIEISSVHYCFIQRKYDPWIKLFQHHLLYILVMQ